MLLCDCDLSQVLVRALQRHAQARGIFCHEEEQRLPNFDVDCNRLAILPWKECSRNLSASNQQKMVKRTIVFI